MFKYTIYSNIKNIKKVLDIIVKINRFQYINIPIEYIKLNEKDKKMIIKSDNYEIYFNNLIFIHIMIDSTQLLGLEE